MFDPLDAFKGGGIVPYGKLSHRASLFDGPGYYELALVGGSLIAGYAAKTLTDKAKARAKKIRRRKRNTQVKFL